MGRFSDFVDRVFPCVSSRVVTNDLRRNISLLGIVMGVLAPCAAIVSMTTANDSAFIAFGFAAACAAFVSTLGFKWLPRAAAKANLYMFAKEALYVTISGALGYWYTADDKCNPGGPQFSYTFYSTIGNVVSSIAGAIGAALFQRYFGHSNFRTVFYITTTLRIVASAFDVLLVTRGNLKIGIPDHYAYMLGDAIIYQMSYVLDFMPAVMLTAALCPHGLESTMYALLAGFANFGQILSQSLGTVLISAFSISTEDGKCDFRNLAPLIVLCHGALPFATLALARILLPDRSIGESLDGDAASPSGAATAGPSRRVTQAPVEANEQALLVEFRSDLTPPPSDAVPPPRPGMSVLGYQSTDAA
jgi:hypothetical protein